MSKKNAGFPEKRGNPPGNRDKKSGGVGFYIG
jgi:hypothetical protein